MSRSLFQKTKMNRWSLGLEHNLGWNAHPEKSTVALFFIFLIHLLTLFSLCLFFFCISLLNFSLSCFFFFRIMPLDTLLHYLSKKKKPKYKLKYLFFTLTEVLLDFKIPNVEHYSLNQLECLILLWALLKVGTF